MMRLTMLFLLLFSSNLFSQNLVPNPSFEEIKDTIRGFTNSDIHFEKKIKTWTTPNTASPDLITPEFYERYIEPPKALSGSNMIGIQSKMDWAEYVGVELKEALMPAKTYYVEYYIRRAQCISPSKNKDQIMNPNFGILFSSDTIKIADAKMLVGSPQINLDTQLLITDRKWVKISKFFTPKQSYHKLYLGQFYTQHEYPKTMNGYFVIDDVSVIELTDFTSLGKNSQLSKGNIIPLNQIHFLTGTTQLEDEESSHKVLEDLATYLNLNPSIKVRINGHTDAQGSNKSNLRLSKRRAKSIAKLIIEHGVSKNRITWKGFGEAIPIADNTSEAGRLKNRRVEFEVME